MTFVGRLSTEKVWEENLNTDVLVLPSIPHGNWEETQACVLQESMLARAVIVSSRMGGVQESIAPEMQRFSFDAGNSEQMASALAGLSRLTAEELAGLGERGRRFVERNYDIAALNRLLLERSLRGSAANR